MRFLHLDDNTFIHPKTGEKIYVKVIYYTSDTEIFYSMSIDENGKSVNPMQIYCEDKGCSMETLISSMGVRARIISGTPYIEKNDLFKFEKTLNTLMTGLYGPCYDLMCDRNSSSRIKLQFE